MAKKNVTSDPIPLKGPRLSFARLYTPKAFQPGQDPRYEATYLLDPSDKDGAESIKLVLSTAAKLGQAVHGVVPYEVRKLAAKFAPGLMKPIDPKVHKPDGIKVAFGDGDEKAYDGYAGMMYVASHNKVRPAVVNRRREAVVEGEDGAPYSGCYVNAKITLWGQDNQYGKRINANLRSVQFLRPGSAFGIGTVDPDEEFEALEDEEPSRSEAAEVADTEDFD